MRRESIWAEAHAHQGRKAVSAKSGRGSISGERAEGFTSSAAAFIADPHAFRPVHLYQPQFALHASFTPAHMPLPVHLGIQTYFKPDTRMADAEMFAPNDETKRLKAVENIVKVASHGNASTTHRKRMTNLREHLATVANFSTHPHLASLLESNPSAANAKSAESSFEAAAHDPTVVFEGFALEEFHPNDFGPSSEFNRTTTFDEMVQARLNGRAATDKSKNGTASLSPVQEADLAWETVLDKMSAAATPSASTKAAPESSLTLATAVSEVESLLSRLGLAPSTAPGSTGGRSFIRGTSSRRMGRVAQRAFRPSRVSLVGVDLQMDEMAWMDSVKRKRQKKISKHKWVPFLISFFRGFWVRGGVLMVWFVGIRRGERRRGRRGRSWASRGRVREGVWMYAL